MNKPVIIQTHKPHWSSDEALEIRLWRPRLDHGNGPFVLAASVGQSGMIRTSLSRNGTGVSQALSNLNNGTPFPQKAAAGWQVEVIAWVQEKFDRHGENRMEIR